MKLYFRDLECYKNVPVEKQNYSNLYYPDYYFDLDELPTIGLKNELAYFIIERGKELRASSLYDDRKSYLICADFLRNIYPSLETLDGLDCNKCISNMNSYLKSKGIPTCRKSGAENPALVYMRKAINYYVPKNRIYFSELDCYLNVPLKKQSSARYQPNNYFDLARLPTDTLITEFEEFIRYRGTLLSFSSIEKDRQGYQQFTDFITTVKPAVTSLKNLHSLPIDKLLRRWFLSNAIPMTYTQKKRCAGKLSTSSHPLFGYVKTLLDYFSDDDGSFHYEDDIWDLKRLDIMLRLPAINTINILNFSQIPITEIKNISKEVTLSRLTEASASTVRAEVHATTQFAKFLEMYLPEIESFGQVTRTVMEEYLSYLYTVDDRKKSYRTELMHLKTVLNTAGKILGKRELSHIFLPTDFDRQTLGIFTFYTDAEIQRLNRGFRSLPPQIGRAMILQELLGIRISDTLTLKSDCVIKKADGSLFIHIHQPKVNRSFEKPISKDVLSLIESSINYTTSLYGKCEYIFVCDKNPSQPMKYSMLHYHLSCIIHDLDLRDDNGNLFGVSTHIFRHVYGKKLCDMGLDDSTIAALLGHSGTSSVKHYRQMGNKALAQETKQLRANKDAKIKQFKEEW